jgi:oligopeptide transport system ATP-binding protein
MAAEEILLRVQQLKKYFPVAGRLFQREARAVKAVDDVSFEIHTGETLGLVGESGCGKTTLARAILQLDPPTSGSVELDGRQLVGIQGEELRRMRTRMQIIFQNPYSSLNPRMTVGRALLQPMIVHGIARGKEAEERASELLRKVGLSPNFANRFPVEFSGGQRQRIGIARALSVNPGFVVCDEPISSLDVSMQAQIVNLLRRLQRELNLTYLFISHDLAIVRYISNRMAVMYLGKIVEIGESRAICGAPLHPYTQALWSAVPIADPELEARRKRILLEGDVPTPLNPPSGCRFHPRCRMATAICKDVEPELIEVGSARWAACHNI